MSIVICDTSPIQYLDQIGMLNVLHILAGNIIVPPGNMDNLSRPYQDELLN